MSEKIRLRLDEDASFGFGCGALWFEQRAIGFSAADIREDECGISFRVTGADGISFSARLIVLENGVELRLSGEGCPETLAYPGATQVQAGDTALLPIGGGFAFPVDDPAVRVIPEDAAGWSVSQCMGMTGLTRGASWLVTAIEDPSDVIVCRRRNAEGLLQPFIQWMAQEGRFGYERVVRYLAGETGGLAAACRAYRAYRQAQGLVVTLREKRAQAPQLDRLIGAADVWLWHDDYEKAMYSESTAEFDLDNHENVLRVMADMKSAGLERAIVGLFFRDDCRASEGLSHLGYLVTKYDNFSDILPGDVVPLIPKFRIRECDYTERRAHGWPQDVRVNRDGSLCGAWALRGTDGVMHAQNSMCARRAAIAARREVGEYAKRYGCDAWFIDVIGGGLQACYSPAHPMTRRESRAPIVDTLQSMLDAGLVSGTEEGVEFCVPALCYAEGRMSPQQYRINYLESGRRKAHLYAEGEHEPVFDRFMLNPAYRAPLWEMVYHDCTVSYWYWGDSSNCCMELLPRRDLFNALYGTPPLYSFHTGEWPLIRERVLASQKRACAVARRVGWEAMTDFEYLTDDKLVQRTVFSDGTAVTANFSDRPYCMEDGTQLAPEDYRMTGGAEG